MQASTSSVVEYHSMKHGYGTVSALVKVRPASTRHAKNAINTNNKPFRNSAVRFAKTGALISSKISGKRLSASACVVSDNSKVHLCFAVPPTKCHCPHTFDTGRQILRTGCLPAQHGTCWAYVGCIELSQHDQTCPDILSA